MEMHYAEAIWKAIGEIRSDLENLRKDVHGMKKRMIAMIMILKKHGIELVEVEEKK